MTPKTKTPYATPKGVEVGTLGPMSDEAHRQHMDGIHKASRARATRESAPHDRKTCRCWACLYLTRLERTPQ